MPRLLNGTRLKRRLHDMLRDSQRRESLATGIAGVTLVLFITPFLPGESPEAPDVTAFVSDDLLEDPDVTAFVSDDLLEDPDVTVSKLAGHDGSTTLSREISRRATRR